jgi:hypothetical protein
MRLSSELSSANDTCDFMSSAICRQEKLVARSTYRVHENLTTHWHSTFPSLTTDFRPTIKGGKCRQGASLLSLSLKIIVLPLARAAVNEIVPDAATARGVGSRSGSPQHFHGAHSPINLVRAGVAGSAAPPSANPFSHDAFARCQPRVWIGLQGRPRLAAPLPMTSRRNRPRLSRVVLPHAAKELDQ